MNSREERVAEELRMLSDDRAQAVEMLAALFDPAPSGLTAAEAGQKLDQLLGRAGAGTELLAELKRLQLIETQVFHWKEVVVVPEVVWTQLLPRTAETLAQTVELHTPQLRVIENHGFSLYQDMLTMMTVFAQEPVEVSQKGHVYKRTMKKMMALFRTNESYFPEPFGDYMPKNFYFLEALLKRPEWVDYGECVKINRERFAAWLQHSYADWAHEIHSFYVSRVFLGPRVPVRYLVSMFACWGRGNWVDMQTVYKALTEKLGAWGIVLHEQHLDFVCYRPFLLLGLIESAEAEGGRRVWRWTDFGTAFVQRHFSAVDNHPSPVDDSDEKHIYVQPNLEILVPESAPPAIRWGIGAFAELLRVDAVLTFRLTRDKVIDALEAGWSFGELQSFLDRHSKTPVAANVLDTMRAWTENYGKAAIWDVMVLHLENRDLADRLRGASGIQIAGSFSANALIIRRQDEDRVRKWLRDAGCTVPASLQKPEDDERKPRAALDVQERREVRLINLKAFEPESARYRT